MLLSECASKKVKVKKVRKRLSKSEQPLKLNDRLRALNVNSFFRKEKNVKERVVKNKMSFFVIALPSRYATR